MLQLATCDEKEYGSQDQCDKSKPSLAIIPEPIYDDEVTVSILLTRFFKTR